MIPGSPARLKRKWPSPTTAAWSHASRGLKPCHWRRASCWCLPAPGPETCRCHPSTAKICDFSPEKPPDFGKKWHWIINHVDFVIGSWPLWLSAMGWESQWWAPQPQIVRGFTTSDFACVTVDGCEFLHHLIDVYPIIYRVSTIRGDAGFLPSTVVSDCNIPFLPDYRS